MLSFISRFIMLVVPHYHVCQYLFKILLKSLLIKSAFFSSIINIYAFISCFYIFLGIKYMRKPVLFLSSDSFHESFLLLISPSDSAWSPSLSSKTIMKFKTLSFLRAEYIPLCIWTMIFYTLICELFPDLRF